MIVYVNDTVRLFDFCSVVLNRYSFSQFFEIQDVDNVYKIGDRVLITHENGEKLIEGEIEYIRVSDSLSIYKGRNKMSRLVDSNFTETKQFSAKTKISNILRDICAPYSVDIKGTAEGFQNAQLTCHAGENISTKIKDICLWGGVNIAFGADNIIYINEKARELNTDFQFVYGGTIIKREAYIEDKMNSFDKYTVHSLYNKASYGQGKEKVLCYDINLSQADCLRSAYNAYIRNRQKTLSYLCLISGEEHIVLNDSYLVKDFPLGVDTVMRLKSVIYEQSFEKYNIKCMLEYVD